MKYKTIIISLFFGLTILTSCSQNDPKINGISFVASSKKVTQEHIDPVIKINANHASVMPFGFVKNLNHPEVQYNSERQWYGESKEGVKQYIRKLHENNIQVMLKPQIWVWQGEYTGHIQMHSEEEWKVFEDTYRNFIIEFAKVAQDSQVKIFCIGTELEQFIILRPEYWTSLISEIKEVYTGKLTYAANWDEYKRVPFWNQLDYIGVDAYFPISEKETPTLEEAQLGWNPWKKEMKALSHSVNKKILFTEYGYRSVNYTGKEPWDSNRDKSGVNLEAQNNATKALFEEIWNEDWFAGGYVWKWFLEYDKVGGLENNMFTPQNKPVEDIIRGYYKIN